jgi:hypothetical protein
METSVAKPVFIPVLSKDNQDNTVLDAVNYKLRLQATEKGFLVNPPTYLYQKNGDVLDSAEISKILDNAGPEQSRPVLLFASVVQMEEFKENKAVMECARVGIFKDEVPNFATTNLPMDLVIAPNYIVKSMINKKDNIHGVHSMPSTQTISRRKNFENTTFENAATRPLLVVTLPYNIEKNTEYKKQKNKVENFVKAQSKKANSHVVWIKNSSDKEEMRGMRHILTKKYNHQDEEQLYTQLVLPALSLHPDSKIILCDGSDNLVVETILALGTNKVMMYKPSAETDEQKMLMDDYFDMSKPASMMAYPKPLELFQNAAQDIAEAVISHYIIQNKDILTPSP